MVRTAFEYLDFTVEKYPNKIAFVDSKRSITFLQLQQESLKIANALIDSKLFKVPIAILLDKSVEAVSAFLGVAYSGNFYTPIDVKMPLSRIEKIIETLKPAVVVTDEGHMEFAQKICGRNISILNYESEQMKNIVEERINETKDKVIDTDALYILFTSGSTGVPKGVVVSHKSLIDFVDWSTECFRIDDTFVFGNQTPFYFSMSILDIYATIANGATTYIIPQLNFSFPAMLMQYLYDRKINTLFWVPSALILVANFKALSSPHLSELRNVFFGGEVMPVKQLNEWIAEYPNIRYVNFYGPTEVTDTCSYYEVNRKFDLTENLPIGFPCRNKDVFLLDDENRLVEGDGLGEICVRGAGLSFGYYNDFERTSQVFTQNPLNTSYPEFIYRTGDIAKRNKYGELVYISRKDFQIKHMGHRIELGEIETAVSSIEGIDTNCCFYDKKRSMIFLVYNSKVEKQKSFLIETLQKIIPPYMMPNKIIFVDSMPYNQNGKIDRQKLREQFIEMEDK